MQVLIILALIFPAALPAADKSFIVGFKNRPGLADRDLIHRANGKIKRTFKLIPAMVTELSEQEIDTIRNDKNVSFVEEDSIVTAVQSVPGPEYLDAWGIPQIGADLAHESGNRGQGVKIAVIDSGIDYTHPDLDGNYKGGYDFVFKDEDPHDDSWNSHGTHVAGVIAAEADGEGVVGVAPEADLYAVKVLDGAGYGLISWVIAGLEWAVENEMDVVNMSIGHTEHNQALQDACDRAYEAGLLLVGAAGNTRGGEVTYPGVYESVIAVTATDQDDLIAWMSPEGPEVELSAPGLGVWSTVRRGHGYLHGTSQAAPHVTGTAALFLSAGLDDVNGDQNIDVKDLRATLQATAVDLDVSGRDSVYGYGLVDAASALWPSVQSMNYTLMRNHTGRWGDAVTVSLSEAIFEIKITNHGLTRVVVNVFENGLLQRELSTQFRFKKHSKAKKQRDQESWVLDATGASYEVVIIPQGRRWASADIEILY